MYCISIFNKKNETDKEKYCSSHSQCSREESETPYHEWKLIYNIEEFMGE